jgi:putative two-component system hydrogenase maturation factor HypX/HoxX
VKILLLASSFSGLCQRVLRELIISGHSVEQHYGMDEIRLRSQIAHFEPELIICPFLTHRIPEDIWRNHRCLVVHPGIEGDRGPSSLDWAIRENADYWGVTLLQAETEMDAGAIWGTAEFPLRRAGKTSIYKREVSTAAVRLIKQALQDVGSPRFRPRPLNYADPKVKGTLRDTMRQLDRKIDWQRDSTTDVLQQLRAGDTSPGVLDELFGSEVFLYGPVPEPHLKGKAGEILAVAYGAVCRATRDGAVWIRQMKCRNAGALPAIKLAAADVLKTLIGSELYTRLTKVKSETPNDIRVDIRGPVAYIYFDFYNGAANTQQCERLRQTIIQVKHQPVKTLVFMGGEDFFSNGIHLNCIEAAPNPADESWANINAIDDVVREIIDSPNHLTIAALRNNAGAGGAILPLACDRVVIRDGVVLNPHYDNMGLYGSEYWTYLLPQKVGSELAFQMARECHPMLASEAFNCGLADTLLDEEWEIFHQHLFDLAARATMDEDYQDALAFKRQERINDEQEKPLAAYRDQELERMRMAFYDPNSRFHWERRKFVYKGKLPVQTRVSEPTPM